MIFHNCLIKNFYFYFNKNLYKINDNKKRTRNICSFLEKNVLYFRKKMWYIRAVFICSFSFYILSNRTSFFIFVRIINNKNKKANIKREEIISSLFMLLITSYKTISFTLICCRIVWKIRITCNTRRLSFLFCTSYSITL